MSGPSQNLPLPGKCTFYQKQACALILRVHSGTIYNYAHSVTHVHTYMVWYKPRVVYQLTTITQEVPSTDGC